MRDGFAVAEPSTDGGWRVTQTVVAGAPSSSPLRRGEAARIFTGGELPAGAIGIIPEEKAFRRGGTLTAEDGACSQRFVLSAGSDVRRGDVLATAGTRVRPALAGLLAAGGRDEIDVHAKPRIGLVATGDELVLPGHPLGSGQLYASNAVVMQNWLARFGMECIPRTCVDDREELQRMITELLPNVEAIVTSGGAWKSERDHTLAAFAQLGWEPTYRMARLAPGKATAHGVLQGKPVFCLPGGPPANELTFLLLALPALQQMAGGSPHPFPTVYVTLSEELTPTPGWTRVHQIQLAATRAGWVGKSTRPYGRMHGPAKTDALVLHTSDEPMAAGTVVEALLLSNPEEQEE